MSEPRAIRADYASWRPVMGRKVLQLIFEVPVEDTAEVMNKLGVPVPGESRWCGIALLDPAPVAQRIEQQTSNLSAGGSNPSGGAKRKFSDLPFPQQCAIRCSDEGFQFFIHADDEESAAQQIREYCAVKSRSEILPGTQAAKLWCDLEELYQKHITQERYADSLR